MEIMNLTFFGIPIIGFVAIWGVGYTIWIVFKGWRQHRTINKGLEKAASTFREKYRWDPEKGSCTDEGGWARKDGLSDYD